jgi:hypothetical protein
MVTKNRSFKTDESMQQVVESAIESEIGSLDTLPPEVAVRLRDVYGEFLPAYVEIIRIKEGHPAHWQPARIVPDPGVVEDMLHFFSDYQDIARSFKQINRQVKNLLKIDRQVDPHRFERCVAEIVSGPDGSSLMDSLVGQ